MKAWLRRLAPVLLIVAALFGAKLLIASREPPERSRPPVPVPLVEIAAIERGDYRVELESRGVVEPAVEASLVAQVAGVVVETSEALVDGGFFEEGMLLLRIDPRDYQSALQIAEAQRVQAELALAEEQARAEQAARDWARLDNETAPSDLALRKPQLANARAALAAAEARLAQARLDLERTEVRAPWAGQVRSKRVDVGQFVAAGTVLAEIYATARVEIRLPLGSRQVAQLGSLPAIGSEAGAGDGPRVTLHAGADHWQGRIVRAEGTVDPASRQQFVIAEVQDPYGLGAQGRTPLRIGQFVEARIEARLLPEVLAIPREAVHEADTVYLLDDQQRLRLATPQVLWRDSRYIVTGDQLPSNRVVTSALVLASPGMQLRVADAGAGDRDRSSAP